MVWPGYKYSMGEKPPWYMGLAWREWHTDHYILMPIPVNFIARYARDFYYWVRQGGSWPRALDEAYFKGYRAGVASQKKWGKPWQ